MPIRIVSENGFGHNIKLLDQHSGEEIKNLNVMYDGVIKLGPIITAELQLYMVAVDVVPDKVSWMANNPETGKYERVSSVEFASGTVVKYTSDGDVLMFRDGEFEPVNMIEHEKPHTS